MPDAERLQRRVDELEATVAFQDRTLSQLNQVLTELFGRVERAEARLAKLELGGSPEPAEG